MLCVLSNNLLLFNSSLGTPSMNVHRMFAHQECLYGCSYKNCLNVSIIVHTNAHKKIRMFINMFNVHINFHINVHTNDHINDHITSHMNTFMFIR